MDYGEGAVFGMRREPEMNLRVVFPPSFRGKLYINQPFGIYETKREIQVASDFAALYDGTKLLALIHEGTPGYFYNRETLSIILADESPPVRGLHTYKYSLYTHGEGWEAPLLRKAQELYNPPLVILTDIHKGELPPEISFAFIDEENFLLSAMYHEGNRVFMRMYETTGSEAEVKVKIFKPAHEVYEVKLNGEIVRKLEICGGGFSLKLPPWRILTVMGNFDQR